MICSYVVLDFFLRGQRANPNPAIRNSSTQCKIQTSVSFISRERLPWTWRTTHRNKPNEGWLGGTRWRGVAHASPARFHTCRTVVSCGGRGGAPLSQAKSSSHLGVYLQAHRSQQHRVKVKQAVFRRRGVEIRQPITPSDASKPAH